MTQHTSRTEQAVLAAMGAARTDKSIVVTRDATVFDLVDSLGLLVALTDIQYSLGLTLDPPQLLQVMHCQCVGDVIATLERLGAQDGGNLTPAGNGVRDLTG